MYMYGGFFWLQQFTLQVYVLEIGKEEEDD